MAEKIKNKDIADNIAKIKKKDSYEPFEAGYFHSAPEMEGYLYKIKGPKNPSYLVVNTAKDFKYKREFVKTEGYNFIFYNSPSIDTFVDDIVDYMSDIIKYIKDMFIDNDGNELPRGYFKDENGDIKVDVAEAQLIRKIFKQYTTMQSIRKVASSNRTDYSYVRDVLHDDRYQTMPIKIIPDNDMKKVWQILQANRKNLYQKQDFKQSLKSKKLFNNKDKKAKSKNSNQKETMKATTNIMK